MAPAGVHGKPHIRLCAVGTGLNDLCRCLVSYCPVKFILNCCKKIFCYLTTRIVIGTALSINISNFLVEPSLTCPDITNPRQLLFEVIFTENVVRVLQTFIIHGETFDDVLFKPFRRPDAEMGSLWRIYPVPDRNNCVEIIEFYGTCNLSVAFSLNLCNFCTSCLFPQFICFIDISKVLCNDTSFDAEKFCNLWLWLPDIFIMQKNLYFHLTIGRRVEKKLIKCIIQGWKFFFFFILQHHPSWWTPQSLSYSGTLDILSITII